MQKLLMVMGYLAMSTGVVTAGGVIDQACQSSARAGSAELCGCIQAVADQMLEGPEQRRAATFFRDPDKAQAQRQADSSSAGAFWQRYETFAAAAGQVCAGG